MSSSSTPLFASLPQRPPTPPKDRISEDVNDALQFLENGHSSPSKTQQIAASTEASGPSTIHSPSNPHQRTSGAGKKVDFSPQPTYHSISQAWPSNSPNPRPLESSTALQKPKPLRSILKPASEASPLTPEDIESKLSYFSPEEPESFKKMLHSVLRQLASQSRSSRLDAYLALNGSLKTYGALPDPLAMVERMPLLMQFLSRDMAWKDADGVLDTNIVTQALQLACAILFNSKTSQALDDDFRAFVVDRSALMLEQPNIAKAVVKNHMFLLSQNRFAANIMTSSRIDRIITALKTIEERCSGNSAIAARLVIYQRLVEQAAATMLAKMHEWIEYVLHGLLCTNREIRVRAIDACSQAGYILGVHHQASKVLHDVLETEIEEGQTYGDLFNHRLVQMISDKETGSEVPRIWASIILFFRCRRRPIHKWPKLRIWLMTMQRCFNSSDLMIKQQAALAWNKLVFAVMPDSTTSEICRSMLKVPIAASIGKPGHDKNASQLRQLALDSYTNLLHYALRPGLSHEELDLAWDMYVEPVLAVISRSSSKGPQQVCRILAGLFRKTSGAWNSNAAMEAEPIKPEELPRLDVRWVRSRLRRIVSVLEPVLETALRSPMTMAPINNSWTLLWQAVAEAGAQEVRTSNELRDALAQATNLFRRLWRSGPSQSSRVDGTLWLKKFHDLLKISVESLGSRLFVEESLLVTPEDEVEAAPTPSHRSAKTYNSARCSLFYLFALYYQLPSGIKADEAFYQSAAWLLTFVSATKTSVTERLGMLTQVLQQCPKQDTNPVTGEVMQRLWAVIAKIAIDLMAMPAPIILHESQHADIQARHGATLIVTGVRLLALDYSRPETVFDLYTAIHKAARDYTRDEKLAANVVEPTARALTSVLGALPVRLASRLATHVLQSATWPTEKPILDQTRKTVTNNHQGVVRPVPLEPCKHLCTLVAELLRRMYPQSPEKISMDESLAFLKVLTTFLHRCPVSKLPFALQQLQNGLAIWIEDPRRSIFPLTIEQQSPSSNKMQRHVSVDHQEQATAAWSSVLDVLRNIAQQDSGLLEAVDLLMIAGFSSPSRDIVNSTILFWNSTFGAQETLAYPPQLLPILRARLSETELSLPCFPASSDNEPIACLPSFAASQIESLRTHDSTLTISRNGGDNAYEHRQNMARKRNDVSSSKRSAQPSDKTLRVGQLLVSKPKLRHDDSQVEFEPILSSPLPAESASQLLTDHQNDVKIRQQADARMYLDLSSSPAVQASRTVPKKIDFSSDTLHAAGEDFGTPSGPSDCNPMSDDLPSSPTPRGPNRIPAVEDSDEYGEDPPSSPPRCNDEPAVQRHLMSDQVDISIEAGSVTNTVQDEQDATRLHENPMDSAVGAETSPMLTAPTNQAISVQYEDDVTKSTEKSRNSSVAVSDLQRQISSAIAEGQSNTEESEHFENDSASNRRISTESQQDDASMTVNEASQQPYRPHKRKRSRAAFGRAKKRSKASSSDVSIAMSERCEDSDEALDEIVVTIRNPKPAIKPDAEEAEDAPQSAPLPYRAQDRRHLLHKTHSSLPDPSARSMLSTSILGNSDMRAESEVVATKAVRDNVARQRQRDYSVMTSRHAHESPVLRRGTKRKVSAVLIPGQEPRIMRSAVAKQEGQGNDSIADFTNIEDTSMDGSDAISPDKQLTQEHSVAIHGRQIAQPQSIIARLRGVLSDCRKIIFGPQEERELDDVLFELRQEVHEASRRGRALQG